MPETNNIAVEKHIDMLGRKAKDRVTGFQGVVTSVAFDLYGCIQAVVTPEAESGCTKISDGHWFDIARLSVSGQPVMKRPDFVQGYVAEGKKGCAQKPLR